MNRLSDAQRRKAAADAVLRLMTAMHLGEDCASEGGEESSNDALDEHGNELHQADESWI